MYKEMLDDMKQHVRESGKIEFRSAVKFSESGVFSGKVPYRINYVYNKKLATELLGGFALSVTGGIEYLMTNLAFTEEACPPALRDALLELIVEKAVAEAKAFCVENLVIETTDPKIVEALTDFDFRIAKYEMLRTIEKKNLYRCIKRWPLNYYSK